MSFKIEKASSVSRKMEEPEILTPCSSGRRRSGDSKSPEFEFWMIGNPSFPQPNLHSADELFSNGVLLPLHRLHLSNEDPSLPPPQQDPQASDSGRVPPEPESSTVESTDTSSFTSSKRWRDIFKKNEKKSSPEFTKNINIAHNCHSSTKEKDVISSVREKRREKKNGGGGGVATAELNINIWPFSRSRSAGNGGSRPRTAAGTRKVSSAPCSRSNSAGESKSRKWPSSPSRAGVHLGRTSPVWQVRRSGGGGGRSSEAFVKGVEKGLRKDGNDGRRNIPAGSGSKARVSSLNVPMCIGYRQHLSCRSGGNYAGGVAVGGAAGEGGRGSNLFNIRSLFTKKVY